MKSLSFCLPAALAFASFLLANADHALAQRIGTRVQYLHENLAGVQDDAEPHEGFGSSLASGDFNADGVDDLAVGVYDATSGTVIGEGAVHVFYGRSGTALYPLGQYWTSNLICGEPVETNDHFGSTLAAGDFDGDGVDDLAIGSSFEDVGDDDAGLVQVVFGLRGVGLSNTRCQKWHQDSGGIAGEAESDDGFGGALAAGDFNADGIDDLAVGVSGEGLGGVFFENFSAGAVQILNGQWGVGLTATGSLWLEQGGTLQGHSLPGSVETPDRFGDTLAVGDLNGDGVDDLAIGAPGENDGGGVVIAVYGRRGFGLTGRDSQSWSQDTADIPDNQEDLDVFGQALAIADWNGDGIDDLAVGAYYETVGTAVGAGTVHILNGSTAGLTAAGTLQLTQDSGSLADAVETNDWFGVALVAGDFDADGRADLAISAEGESSTAGIFAGVVHLLKGSASGLTTTGNRMWSQDSTNVGGASHPYGRFGAKLAAGDFDGDGSADLAIGSPFDDPGVLDAGSVNVLTQLDDFVPILPFP
jgi:FG-GAP repeat